MVGEWLIIVAFIAVLAIGTLDYFGIIKLGIVSEIVSRIGTFISFVKR